MFKIKKPGLVPGFLFIETGRTERTLRQAQGRRGKGAVPVKAVLFLPQRTRRDAEGNDVINKINSISYFLSLTL